MAKNSKAVRYGRLLLSLIAACLMTAALSQKTTNDWWPGLILGAFFWVSGALTMRLRPKVGYLTSWAFLTLVLGLIGFLLGALAPSVLVEGGWWVGARAGATLGSSLVLVAAVMIVPPRYIWRSGRSMMSLLSSRRGTKTDANTKSERQSQSSKSTKKKRSTARRDQRRARKVSSRSRR
jgi:hypothetical protein